MHKVLRVPFVIDPSWSARRIADEVHAFSNDLYRKHPDVLQNFAPFLNYSASKTALWPLLTPEERSELDDFPLLVVPTCDFDVRMVVAPSGSDKFIIFDQCILQELMDFFTAIPNQRYPVWAACILRGATRQTTGPRLDLVSWAETPLREFKELRDRGEKHAPYSSSMLFGVEFCMDFLLAHEYAHHALKHFSDEPLNKERDVALIKDHLLCTSQDMEFAADAWSVNVISRLPVFELSSWTISIEMMFWYLSLIESFERNRRTIKGMTPGQHDHPDPIVRAERISRLAERIFEFQLDEAGNLPQPLFNNLHDRQLIWAQVKKFDVYAHYLAEWYCCDPEETVAIHDAVRAGELDMDQYEAKMKSLTRRHRLDSIVGGVKRLFHSIKSKLF